jgi:hypothetical protein
MELLGFWEVLLVPWVMVVEEVIMGHMLHYIVSSKHGQFIH